MSPQYSQANVQFEGDCRNLIPSRICIFPDAASTDFPIQNCNPDPELNAGAQQIVLNSYDHLPRPHQLFFCSLPKLFIDSVGGGGGASDIFVDPITNKHQLFVSIGTTKEALRGNPPLRESLGEDIDSLFRGAFNTKPGQKAATAIFGTDPQNVGKVIHLPGNILNDSFYIILVHELGHIIDQLNGVNFTNENCPFSSYPNSLNPNCDLSTAPADSWSRIAWVNQRTSVFDNESTAGQNAFPNRKKFEGLFSEEYPADSEINGMIDGLFTKTTFLSPLAAAQPFDDWAESSMYWVLFNQFEFKEPLSVVSRNNKVYNLVEIFNSDRFASKRKYMDHFFARNDLNFYKPEIAEFYYQPDVQVPELAGYWEESQAQCQSGATYQNSVDEAYIVHDRMKETFEISQWGRFLTDNAYIYSYNADFFKRLLVDIQNELDSLAQEPQTDLIIEQTNKMQKAKQNTELIISNSAKNFNCLVENFGHYNISATTKNEMDQESYIKPAETNFPLCPWKKANSIERESIHFDLQKETMTITYKEVAEDHQPCPKGDRVIKVFNKQTNKSKIGP